MNKLVKRVRELDAEARKKVEEGLETPLADDSEIEFVPAETIDVAEGLSKKYHVYEGLSDQEIDELEQMILDRDDW